MGVGHWDRIPDREWDGVPDTWCASRQEWGSRHVVGYQTQVGCQTGMVGYHTGMVGYQTGGGIPDTGNGIPNADGVPDMG